MACGIYKYENLHSGNIYIGKALNIDFRLHEHLLGSRNPNHKEYNSIINTAIRKDGIESFDITILEECEPEQLNKREKYWIAYYDSYHNGYNATIGGDGGRISTKLLPKDVIEIIKLLQDTECLLSFDEIGKKYGVKSSTIQLINRGQAWSDIEPKEKEYPIRKYSVVGLSITRNTYQKILNDLLSTKTLSDICKQYNISEQVLHNINYGLYCYNQTNNYYADLAPDIFPIRPAISIKKDITPNEFLPIIYEVLTTKQSIATLGEKYGITGNTLQYWCSGKRRKDLTEGFILPLRSNCADNLVIYERRINQCVMQE